VAGVETITFPCPEIDWVEVEGESYTDYSPSEMHIGAAVLHARRVFQENRLAKLDRNQRSGKVNTRVLARRAPVGDDRLFGKKTRPKRRDHLVIISGDCSGSTQSFGRSEKIRRMMMAQGDILHRVGVPFIMLGHSAARAQIKNFSGYSSGDYWTYALMIKDLAEGWGPTTKNRLAALGPIAENLDGHTLEYCRKLADKSNATDVVIIYYTDGEMPAANATEEREVLVREVKTCKRKGYHLLGVGINTDSPKRYGMNTVRVESDADIKLVVEQLEKELTQ
jgi:nitric oxide reductase activation protein